MLQCIDAQSARPGRTIVVDNASTDGTRALLDAAPAVEAVHLGENVGVGAGHRIGWERALADPRIGYVWVLEHDTYPTPACLERLVRTARELQRDGAHLGAVAALLERNEAEAEQNGPREPRVGPHGRFTFNSVLLTREAIEGAGYPREDFFVGSEDWDFACRLERLGFGVYSDEGALALHPTKGDGRYGVRPSPFHQYYSTRNWMYLRRFEERRRFAVLTCSARALAGAGKTLVKEDHKARRIAARVVGARDGPTGRLGRRSYWFLES